MHLFLSCGLRSGIYLEIRLFQDHLDHSPFIELTSLQGNKGTAIQLLSNVNVLAMTALVVWHLNPVFSITTRDMMHLLRALKRVRVLKEMISCFEAKCNGCQKLYSKMSEGKYYSCVKIHDKWLAGSWRKMSYFFLSFAF